MNYNIQVYLSSLKQLGNLVYQYHPFHNFLTAVDLYEVLNFLIPKGLAVNPENGCLLTLKDGHWVDKNGKIINDVIKPDENSTLIKAGSLIDLDTELLNFDINHPVDITIQPSYDGSVNLILNDDKNLPRIINSRFSVREKNTYEIVDRIGENDTNIYNSETFEKDTSLYFLHSFNPKIKFHRLISGNLPVGNYCFYFAYCDSDDNESDFIAESGPIPVFLGTEGNYSSMDGGIKNLNSFKGVSLKLSNIDNSYNYLKVYYLRYFADYNLNRVSECKKLYRKIPINSLNIIIPITGNEEAEDVDSNILNITRFNPKSILTQAQCKNMLFFGNITQNIDNYKELTDCALRIIPRIILNTIEYPVFENGNSKQGYSTVNNIYNKVGYFNNEYYRFGVVFVYDNGTLSNVYNTLGGILNNIDIQCTEAFDEVKEGIYYRKYIRTDESGWISQDLFNHGSNLNSKGVCYLDYPHDERNNIYGISFYIPDEVKTFLKNELHIRGLFFVRQKRIPNLLAQCYLLPMDSVAHIPVLLHYLGGALINLTESFVTKEDLLVTNSYGDRLITYDTATYKYGIETNSYAAICPDFLLNLPYYNQIFNGSKFKLQLATSNAYLTNNPNAIDGRLYRMLDNYTSVKKNFVTTTINSVTEAVPSVAIKDKVFKMNIGSAEEAFRYELIENEVSSGDEYGEEVLSNNKIARGIYSPYLAIYSDTTLKTGELYNIYQDSFSLSIDLFLTRMDSHEPFYAISDRYNFEEISDSFTCWRGDCYLNTFTYRLNRNFNDSTLPNNDKIIDKNTWKNNYVGEPENWAKISRSDINAVKLGSWITINVRSTINYSLRSVDHSYVSEEALMGTPRTFYPKASRPEQGDYKMPDSYLYNDAYRATLGFKCYFTLGDANYIKNTFSNRIQYSAIAILDSYKNNYRYSLSTYYRDYSSEYGSITKLIGFEGYLLVVFEHAIGIAVINERVLMSKDAGSPVFLNTNNVLPEELTIISDTLGSLWSESIIKSDVGYVYGVDTIAKKIWRVLGQLLEIISDFKVGKFLNENITLNERELYPIVGLKNVKTHYNNNKKDIMFTFYDDVYKDEEKIWNLCFNELLGQFTTFYSWIPSYSENIDTQFFTFNRNTSKALALLNKCNYNIKENTGVLLDSPVLRSTNIVYLHYIDPATKEEVHDVEFKLIKDHWNNSKHFKIEGSSLKYNQNSRLLDSTSVVYLEILPVINNIEYSIETVAITLDSTVNNLALTEEDKKKPNFTTDFYLHGQSGIFDTKETLQPTYWYLELHPFEFEFVVNQEPQLLKIFTNLQIISNKAEPESFHFEIEGDNYEFSSDKRAMYVRQEATKELYLTLGSDILYDRKYKDAGKLPYAEQYYNIGHPVSMKGLVQQVKSTIFPLYYEKIDTFNDIYHSYHQMVGNGYDFKNLSGSEVVWDRKLNQFNIITHIKNNPINLVGVLRGNSKYQEGKWSVQIPTISFMLKNEDLWITPPVVINSLYVPKDLESSIITYDKLPNIYTGYLDKPSDSTDLRKYIDTSSWTYRKEAKIRDKWIKVRIRYSGKNLAIIHNIITLYTESYG